MKKQYHMVKQRRTSPWPPLPKILYCELVFRYFVLGWIKLKSILFSLWFYDHFNDSLY